MSRYSKYESLRPSMESYDPSLSSPLMSHTDAGYAALPGPTGKPRSTFVRSQQPNSMVSVTSTHSSLLDQAAEIGDYRAYALPSFKEDDDFLHDPRKGLNNRGHILTYRGLTNFGCIFILVAGMLALFVGYPILTFYSKPEDDTPSFGLGGTNGSGQVPDMAGNWGLIDKDTPEDLYTKDSYNGQGKMKLVFSDEFNEDGRTFYPGDDPYWEAADLHYWATGNMEWYDPDAVTTANGALEITLSQKQTHDLNYQGGMLTTWNKFCFTGGIIEASVQLPGANNVAGLWPAIWMMGNLGRAGYGATTDGLWPYSYDACDYGAAPNQTINGEPIAATQDGDSGKGGALSWQPGQRLSRCTCPGESHPGPKHSDGSFVGRAAPEIDIFEAQIESDGGHVSQSAQFAPFNYAYEWHNTSGNYHIEDETVTKINTYKGGGLQQAISAVSKTNQDCYDVGGSGCYSVYGVEYKPGFDDAYVTWINDAKLAWTLNAAGVSADSMVKIADRPIPQEPMYIIMNLGISTSFGSVDLEHLTFPTSMRVDWIRLYQNEKDINIGCNPKDFPTTDYITQYAGAYNNPNYTTWEDDFKQTTPRSSVTTGC